MKTNFFRKVATVGVFALAVAGAITGNAMERNNRSVATVDAYQKNNDLGTQCDLKDHCSNIFTSTMCTISVSGVTTTLWGINAQNNRCTVPLYRP